MQLLLPELGENRGQQEDWKLIFFLFILHVHTSITWTLFSSNFQRFCEKLLPIFPIFNKLPFSPKVKNKKPDQIQFPSGWLHAVRVNTYFKLSIPSGVMLIGSAIRNVYEYFLLKFVYNVLSCFSLCRI